MKCKSEISAKLTRSRDKKLAIVGFLDVGDVESSATARLSEGQVELMFKFRSQMVN